MPTNQPIYLNGIGVDIVKVAGYTIVRLDFAGHQLTQTFLCISTFPCQILCGNNFLLNNKIVLDYDLRQVRWKSLVLSMQPIIITEDSVHKEIFMLNPTRLLELMSEAFVLAQEQNNVYFLSDNKPN